ncbi:MAG: hypothetical protein JXQ80_01010 [Bacteroidales bacterium]|nr:hypothetical protein [Bacteroidales bacterium]
MKNLSFAKQILHCITWLIALCCVESLYAQETDTLKGRHLYRPAQAEEQDTLRIPAPTDENLQRMLDSLALRQQFIRDSLLAREKFVRDSIARRQRMRDSVVFLQHGVQPVLEAWARTVKDDIIYRTFPIPIDGDSALGDFVYLTMPFGVSDPYVPWKMAISLNGPRVRFEADKKTGKVMALQTPQVRSSFVYPPSGNVLVINEPPVIQNNYNGHFYKMPVDSVFYDRLGRIARIKKFVQFYKVVNNNQRGEPLFINAVLVKQFEYGPGKELLKYQEVRYCERWRAYDANKVCSILNYTFDRQGNTWQLERRNDPANQYSDGNYTFVYDDNDNLTRVSFTNMAKTEGWNRVIEMNQQGNVHCYIDKVNDVVRQSTCFIYNDPQSRFPVETIITTFEKDGISYIQRNNTTGKMRTRDRLTLEWGLWK